jgi:hypothetical protein
MAECRRKATEAKGCLRAIGQDAGATMDWAGQPPWRGASIHALQQEPSIAPDHGSTAHGIVAKKLTHIQEIIA